MYRNGVALPDDGDIVPTTLPPRLRAVGVMAAKPGGSGIATVVPVVPFGVEGVHKKP
jgi:hypothetical protein